MIYQTVPGIPQERERSAAHRMSNRTGCCSQSSVQFQAWSDGGSRGTKGRCHCELEGGQKNQGWGHCRNQPSLKTCLQSNTSSGHRRGNRANSNHMKMSFRMRFHKAKKVGLFSLSSKIRQSKWR